jgi:hypothetical protein
MNTNVEMVKDYIVENVEPNGTFTKRYVDVAHALGLSQNIIRNIMLDIVKEGFLQTVVAPSKGKNSSPIYKLKIHKVNGAEINPIEIDDGTGIKTLTFEGVEINLVLINGVGYCIEASDLMMCILENITTFDKIVKSNSELFDGHIFEIGGKKFISRHGVMTMLLKVNLDKTLPLKRALLAQFQSTIVSVMCDSQLKAKLYISNDNRVRIQHNLNCLLELDSEQVEEMLIDLEYQVSQQFEGLQTKTIQQDRQIHKLESDRKRLNTQIETEKSAKQRLITESNELRSKLLERQ